MSNRAAPLDSVNGLLSHRLTLRGKFVRFLVARVFCTDVSLESVLGFL